MVRQRSQQQQPPSHGKGRFTRAVAILTLVIDIAGAMSIAHAMALYPGGTGAHPHQVGHEFWQNVLCDLAQPVAFNGQPNDAARPFALLGTIAIFLAGGLINLLTPSVTEDRRTAKWARRLGVTAGGVA